MAQPNRNTFILAFLIALTGCKSSPIKTEITRQPASMAYAMNLAEVDPYFAENATREEREAVEALIQEFGPKINIVTEPFSLFHYAPLGQVDAGPAPRIDHPVAKTYVEAKMEKFWSNRDLGNYAGNGLYLSTDPVATYSFGRDVKADSFLLVVIRPQKGTRILSLMAYTAPFSENALTALRKVGCNESTFPRMVVSNECARFVKLSMKALKISGVEYDYQTTMDCETRRTAFVLFEPSVFENDVAFLTSTSDLSDPATFRLAKEVYDLSAKYLVLSATWEKKLKESNAIAASSEDLTKLREKHLMSCPTLKSHLSPLFSFSPAQANGFSSTELTAFSASEEENLVANRDSKIQAVYRGKPLISILSVAVSPEKGKNQFNDDPNLKSMVEAFCNGTPSCLYRIDYLGRFRSRTADGFDIRVEWHCVGKDAQVSGSNSRTFNSVDDKTLVMECKPLPSPPPSVEQSPAKEKSRREKRRERRLERRKKRHGAQP